MLIGLKMMYKSVLLTDEEMSILENILSEYLSEKQDIQPINLTIILNRLRYIRPNQNSN
jgi:hypothetical protein